MEEQKDQQPQEPLLDDRGRRVLDDSGQPIHWATKSERIIAFILALVVIGITIAFAYSLSTGDLIRR